MLRPFASSIIAVTAVPEGAESLLVRLCVHADHTVELACEATFPVQHPATDASDEERPADGDQAEPGGGKRAPAGTASAPRPPPLLLASVVV